MELIVGLAAAAVTVGLGGVGWLIARGVEAVRSQAEANARAVEAVEKRLAAHERDCAARWAANDEQHRSLGRSIDQLREHSDRRFDSIERMLREIGRN